MSNENTLSMSIGNTVVSNFTSFTLPRTGNAISIASLGTAGVGRTLMPNASQVGLPTVSHQMNNGLMQALGQQHTSNPNIVQNYMGRTGTNVSFIGTTAQTNYSAGGLILTHNGLPGQNMQQQQSQHILQIQVGTVSYSNNNEQFFFLFY